MGELMMSSQEKRKGAYVLRDFNTIEKLVAWGITADMHHVCMRYLNNVVPSCGLRIAFIGNEPGRNFRISPYIQENS